MRIDSISISGYRSLEDFTVEFESDLTTFVGENNTGKSSIFAALSFLIHATADGRTGLPLEDCPYGLVGPYRISASLVLTDNEIETILIQRLTHGNIDPDRKSLLEEWVHNHGNEFQLSTDQNGSSTQWQDIQFLGQTLNGSEHTTGGNWADWIMRGPSNQWQSLDTMNSFLKSHSLDIATDITNILGREMVNRFRIMSEFRTRSVFSGTAETESWEGTNTASVLRNLRIHNDNFQRQRYVSIVNTFSRFFPRFRVEAVEDSPGSAIPDIQLIEEGHDGHLSLNQVSAGIHETLTSITNLVGREGLIIVAETPESHLHPHAIRSFQKLFNASKESNQIIIITHDSQFVDPSSVVGLRRVSWDRDNGTRVNQPTPPLDEIAAAQCSTALRQLGNREMVFARVVILVEDESQQEFVVGVAPTLGFDLDAIGLSVVSFNGHDGHPPFRRFLNSFDIPFVALRDLNWNNPDEFPTDRYFSFGCELEQYLDDSGLAALRRETIEDVGTGKPRVARAMAERLGSDDIPPLFSEIIRTASELTSSLSPD